MAIAGICADELEIGRLTLEVQRMTRELRRCVNDVEKSRLRIMELEDECGDARRAMLCQFHRAELAERRLHGEHAA